tara:strand:- start:48 stop:554 length:507 start_codon:yes stop_codon:yes gene_type:complete
MKVNIIDNFFEEQLFLNIQNHVTTKLFYTPRYFEDKTEKNEKNYYGSRFILSQDPELLKTFVTQAEKKFKIKIKKLHPDSGIDMRNLLNFKPHIDFDCVLNIMVMLSGPTAVTNGTVFYTDGELDTHVGFRENRAIMFPSTRYHSPHASKVPNLKRYTASLFVQDYEE